MSQNVYSGVVCKINVYMALFYRDVQKRILTIFKIRKIRDFLRILKR